MNLYTAVITMPLTTMWTTGEKIKSLDQYSCKLQEFPEIVSIYTEHDMDSLRLAVHYTSTSQRGAKQTLGAFKSRLVRWYGTDGEFNVSEPSRVKTVQAV